jgi:hypothetical protein
VVERSIADLFLQFAMIGHSFAALCVLQMMACVLQMMASYVAKMNYLSQTIITPSSFETNL